MASCDYYSCDVCGAKTFYDAEINYGNDSNPNTHHPWPAGVGAMFVICKKCAKTHEIMVVLKGGEGVKG